MPGLSSRELRRFGFTVGGIFLLFAAVSWYRGHVIPPRVFATLGVLLVVPAAVAPRVLGPVQYWWMRGAHVLGEVNGRIILTVMFYLVIAPFGAVLRLFRDPLDRRMHDDRPSNWVRRPTGPVDRARYERQF